MTELVSGLTRGLQLCAKGFNSPQALFTYFSTILVAILHNYLMKYNPKLLLKG